MESNIKANLINKIHILRYIRETLNSLIFISLLCKVKNMAILILNQIP